MFLNEISGDNVVVTEDHSPESKAPNSKGVKTSVSHEGESDGLSEEGKSEFNATSSSILKDPDNGETDSYLDSDDFMDSEDITVIFNSLLKEVEVRMIRTKVKILQH